ncbi:fungal specific transcription factor domain protein [Pyrenophora teres f. maculata]|nr:fungal specific transcription factor domain protein [Pyrenophora teres f. maculata]
MAVKVQSSAVEAVDDCHQTPQQWLGRLDPEWVQVWNAHGGRHRQAEEVPIEEVRRKPLSYSFTYPTWSGPSVFKEDDIEIPVTRPAGHIKIRVYTPEGEGPFPVHLNFHGGGWVLGGLQSEAAWCRSVCNNTGIVIVGVDYRLAPEFVFPTAIYDSWDSLQWVISHAADLNVDGSSVSIGGLSAGGHMSAVLSHMARDAGMDLRLALLVVPSTDFRWLIAEEPVRSDVARSYPSTALYKDAPWGGLKREQWFLNYWIPADIRKAACKDWVASPVLATSFDRLPPTHIITAEFDICRDEAHRNAFFDRQGYILPGELPDPSAGFWLDQAMIDTDVQAFNHINTSPNDASVHHLGLPSPSALGSETTSVLCGLTGDMDPYLMQRYKFGPDNNFVFKRFFQFVYPHIPILPPSHSVEPERSNPSLLAALYLVTLPFAGFDDYLSVQIAYDLPDAEKLWDLASDAVHQELHKADFSTLQTLILLLVASPHKPLMPDYATKWSLVGTMVTVSQTLGLHFDPTHWNILSTEIELRKRLSWAVRMVEVWHAAVLGRSCLIHDDDWLVPEPCPGDFSHEESQTPFPAHFIYMYKLTIILYTTLTKLFSLKAVQVLARDYEGTLRKAQTLVEELNRWYSAATDIQCDSQDEDINLSGPLLLGGHVVKVLLFRAILRPFNVLRSNVDTSSSTHECRELEARRLSRAGAKACVASFVAFTSSLESSWIHGFWPFWCTLGWSTLCNLTLLLHVTSESPEEAQECRILLDRTRRAVRLQSKSLEILRFSLLRIDAIFWKGLDNVLTTRLQESSGVTDMQAGNVYS